jgi:hypothetical protein
MPEPWLCGIDAPQYAFQVRRQVRGSMIESIRGGGFGVMREAIRRFQSLSKNEQLGWLVIGIIVYCAGLIPLAAMAPIITKL